MDHATRANEDAQKNARKYADQIAELQAVIDEEQRRREEFRENFLNAEKKLAAVQMEKEDFMVKSLQVRSQELLRISSNHHIRSRY